jgi:hypothetical protein
MILERGNMWDVWGNTSLFLITTNPITRKDGAAVMGRGIALEAAKKYPEIQRSFGQLLQESDSSREMCNWICTIDGQKVGYFMVKNHWAAPADLGIIERSVYSLLDWIDDDVLGRIDLNFPGIGNGSLPRRDVLPLIQKLPDSVHIWEYGT